MITSFTPIFVLTARGPLPPAGTRSYSEIFQPHCILIPYRPLHLVWQITILILTVETASASVTVLCDGMSLVFTVSTIGLDQIAYKTLFKTIEVSFLDFLL